MQKKQIMIIVLPILAVSLAAIPVVRFVKNEQRKVTAEEWIVNQYHLVGEFNLLRGTAWANGADLHGRRFGE